MINWGGLFANSSWILGCALALALLSYAGWHATLEDSKFVLQLKRPQLLAGFSLAGVLFCAGLMLTSDLVWEQGLWAALGVLFILQLLNYARSIQSLK